VTASTESHEPLTLDADAGVALAERAYAAGLAVTRADGTRRAIPIATTPVVLDAAEHARRRRTTTRLVAATAKVAHAVLDGPGRDAWLAALRPVERRLVERTFTGLDRLATARVDYSVLPAGLAALEVNATIPAMQGYSDIAAQAFIETAVAAAGGERETARNLVAANGSNAEALRQALAALHAAHASAAPLRTIALLARRGDAQSTELAFLSAHFERAGHEAAIVHPDEVVSAQPFIARGTTWQLVYRHLFASRLDEQPAPIVEEAFARWRDGPSLVVNPPAAHLEMKATFARLSELAADPRGARRAGLTDDELAAVRDTVPWTRRLRAGPSDLPEGAGTPDLVAAVAADPARYVLKRSWSYGGVGVLVGSEAGTAAFRERVLRLDPEAPLDWPALCARAAHAGGYVVQHAAPTEARRLALHTPDTRVEGVMSVDYAAYASLGVDVDAWGGVVRAAPSAIVNIVGGGGVVPLLRREVAEALRRLRGEVRPE